MSVDKDRTVCFSGYRPEKFPFSLKDTTCVVWIHKIKSHS